jgi:hypothetical protein
MTLLVEHFDQADMKTDWHTQYVRFRAGRLKHQYWLRNRKNPNKAVIDSYDYTILQNCQEGNTVFFSSAGYYLKDIFPGIHVIETNPVVKSFYPDVYVCTDRSRLSDVFPHRADNFAVVNNRGDHWTTVDGLTGHFYYYAQIMNPGCRVFYSFRDTQIQVNRLTVNLEQHFLHWAKYSMSQLGFTLVRSDINFQKKQPDKNGYYDHLENPDTANGNLKFWFVYQGNPWIPI